MGIFDRPKNQKQIINSIIFGLLLGFVLLALLLILKSTQLSVIKTDITSNVSLGPLNLIQIHKMPLNGGYQATIKLLPGLALYFIACICLSISINVFSLRTAEES